MNTTYNPFTAATDRLLADRFITPEQIAANEELERIIDEQERKLNEYKEARK